MALGKSTYAEAATLNMLLKGTLPATMPGGVSLALYVGNPEAGGVEVSAGGYSRQPVTFGDLVGQYPTQCSNNDYITFATATADWGSVTHIALVGNDDDNVWYLGLTDTVTINSGMRLSIPPNSIIVTEKKTPYSEALVLNAVLKSIYPDTWPSTVYLTFYNQNPMVGGPEIVGGGFARQAIAFGANSGSSPTQCSNSGALNFGTAGTDWGTLIYFSIVDAISGGNMLYSDKCVDVAIGAGTPLTVGIGGIVVTEE